jgi:hypothetical protein
MRPPVVAAIVAALAGPAPAAEAAEPRPLAAPRPEIVSATEWGSKPQPIPDSRKHEPKYVTIHHAGVIWKAAVTPDAFVRNMQSWGQRDKGWPDLAYHFLIAPDGRIFEGRPLAYEPESNTKYPLAGNIGVEMMGSFEVQRPDPRQVASCVKLTAWLCDKYDIDPSLVRGHKDAASGQTSCPGKDFDRYLRDGQFLRWVREAREGKAPAIDLGPPLPGGPTEPIPAANPGG